MRGCPGAGVAGPVLLACRHWDPLGLARRLPSSGAGAWRGAPLLPWRVQCPVRVCAALAGGSGGLGPVPGFMSFPFPPSRSAFPALCVAGRPVQKSLILARWYAIACGLCVPRARSGCPSGIPRVSLACVCARALAASAPPPSLGRCGARTSRSPGAGRQGQQRSPCPSACPASGPCSVWLAWGRGAARSRSPPAWLGVVCPPWGTPQRALLRAGFACCGGGTRAPRGGASCLCGAFGVRHSPTPHRSSFGACGRAHYPLAVGAGCAGVGTRHHTHSARPCELALYAVRVAPGRPGGAPLACVWGVRVLALSHPRPLILWGVLPGPTTHWLWVRGCGRGNPSPAPQRALLRAGFARCGGGTPAPGVAASCLGLGHPGSGALPPPTARPLGRAAGAHYPLAVGAGCAGVGTRHHTHSARPCELALYAVRVAPGRPGGAPLACVWGVRGLALSHPRPLVLWGVLPGPTTHWLWVRGCGRGNPSPAPQRALLRAGFGRCGGGTPAPGVAASCLGLGHPGSGALPPPTARPLGRAAGAHYPLAVGGGGDGVGTRHEPTARALASWLCTLWGRHEGAWGGRLLPGCGASEVGRSPTPDRSPFGACCRGPLPTSCGCGGCGRGYPSPTPPHALVRAGFAGCGGGARAHGGRRPLPGGGASGVGRSPTPHRSSFGACRQGQLPTGYGCGGSGRRDPSPTPARALLRAVFARCGGGTRAPGGGTSCLGVGRPGSAALPPPPSRPLGGAAGAHYPLAVGAGGVGVGTRHQPHPARSCELALRAVGAARVRPRGAPLAWAWGVRGRALSNP